jgi:hypothetical protein
LVWNWKKNNIPFVKLASFCVAHITSQIYFFHISSMKCDSIHFNIMSDIVWSCWSENRENTIIFSFCHIFIDWLVLSANLIIYIVACTSFHNNDLLKCVYTVHNGMNQQTTIICKQNIYIKQIYYFTDSFTLKELSNMKYQRGFGMKVVLNTINAPLI